MKIRHNVMQQEDNNRVFHDNTIIITVKLPVFKKVMCPNTNLWPILDCTGVLSCELKETAVNL